MKLINTQSGFSVWRLLPWLLVVSLAALLVWVAQNPKQNGSQLQSYLPPQLQIHPQTTEPTLSTPPSTPNNTPQTWQPTLANSTPNDMLVVSYHKAVTLAAQSVVNIYTTQTIENPYANDPVFSRFYEYYGQTPKDSLGSGVIVSKDGYIVTNAHVVEKADEITVALNDGRKSRATIIGSDPESDLAVIKVELDNLTPLAFRATPIEVGDVALAIGNPFGVGQTVTQGIISATGRTGLGVSIFEDFIQTDAAINPGNSGGALVDAYGALIGINTVIYSRSGGSMGIGFAIPTTIVENVMTQLIAHGKVSRGWLGVEIANTPTNPTDLNSTTGVTISNVINNGPADKAGIVSGDVVLSVDGVPTNTPNSLIGAIAKKSPNTSASLLVQRGGKQHTLQVTVSERPSANTVAKDTKNSISPQEAEKLAKLFNELNRLHSN